VLVKETGIVVPLVFALWLAKERRWRDASFFLAPLAALGLWVLTLERRTGHWAGNPDFAQYNLFYPLAPLRLLATLLRRGYYLLFADLHWIGALAILYAWRRSRLFHTRSWRIAWLVAGAHVAMFTLLGGAALERYLLPILPILYAGMAAGLSFYSKRALLISAVALLAGLAAGNFINPPYPFPYENNLAFVDFVVLHRNAGDYLQRRHPSASVHTMWPMTAELSNPDLGFVRRSLTLHTVTDLTAADLGLMDWSQVQVLVVFSRTWNARYSLLRYKPLIELWERIYGAAPNLTREEARARIPLFREAQFERRGQWVDVYVNPDSRPSGPYLKARGVK